MNPYIGDEQNNPILEFIRSSSSGEIPNLRQAYKLWNGAKQGLIPSLAQSEAQTWFGHSLFTSNVRMYAGNLLLSRIGNLFSSDPRIPVVLGTTSASYGPTSHPYPDALLQIERYSSLSEFFGHLLGALDVMSVGIAYLYEFESIRVSHAVQGNRRIDPLMIDFPATVRFMEEVNNAVPPAGVTKPVNLINTFGNEGLLTRLPATNKTNCAWYESLKDQRNYHTHVGFPMLYIENGEWKLSADPRGAAPDANLTDNIPILCHDTFGNVHRFIGEVYGTAWTDFEHHLP